MRPRFIQARACKPGRRNEPNPRPGQQQEGYKLARSRRLGPGHPASLLHALGERDDWEHLDVFGALLLDLYPLFGKAGVRYVSGFFGPAERLLIDSGAVIEFVPADFRRFVTIAEQFAPRVVATCAPRSRPFEPARSGPPGRLASLAHPRRTQSRWLP